MDEPRFGETFRDLSRNLASDEGAFRKLVLFGYILVATIIGGAANAGAGLFILAIGLLTLLTLELDPWRAKARPEATAAARELEDGAGEAQASRLADGDEAAGRETARPGRKSKGSSGP